MTAGGLDGERIRNVRVLERFALVEVPADAVPEAVAVRGATVALEPIRNSEEAPADVRCKRR